MKLRLRLPYWLQRLRRRWILHRNLARRWGKRVRRFRRVRYVIVGNQAFPVRDLQNPQ